MESVTVSLDKIIDEMKLKPVFLPDKPENIHIGRTEITRPAFPLAGFYNCFEPDRIQIIGNTECEYLDELGEEESSRRIEAFFATKPATVVYTHSTRVHEASQEAAKKYSVPLLSADRSTSAFAAAMIAFLNLSLAPRITRHGVLVEVYGEGVLILGDSGIGKSETAIELIKRGHRLVADDAVEIKKVSDKTLVGSAPEIIRHYMELRGIGIVDVRRLFGMGSVKDTEKIDLIIQLEPWENGKMYDRWGIEEKYSEIMGNSVPTVTIPVQPGRNLAVIIEIAAMNYRQKKMGYNTPKEFNDRLLERMEKQNGANGKNND
ncbi:MAG: HPr(Ser) kinase/phosphatase [Clostridia bacterium]|nr:HPr(Ser) kinase/phosphatase [Clostridia bacterium]